MEELRSAKDLQNQILYSVEIGEKDSSIISEGDFVRSTASKSHQEKIKSEKLKLFCGIQDQKLIQVMKGIDVLTLIRIPAVISSCTSTRGIKCYYQYRVVTFFVFVAVWIIGLVTLSLRTAYAKDPTSDIGSVISVGLIGAIALTLDFTFNRILRRFLLR